MLRRNTKNVFGKRRFCFVGFTLLVSKLEAIQMARHEEFEDAQG